jgi:hypothetical protein
MFIGIGWGADAGRLQCRDIGAGAAPMTRTETRMRSRLGLLHGASLAILAAMLAGCAWLGGPAEGPPAGTPSLRVGDRWVYRVADGFLDVLRWQETHEVTDAGPSGFTVRVTQRGPRLDTGRVEQWPAPGSVAVGALFDAETRRFTPVLTRFAFPLRPGESWNQWIDSRDEATGRSGRINRWVRVGGWEEVKVPAGTFAAVRLTVLTVLDDEEFWRNPTRCSYTVWYAPAVRGVVREEREAMYTDKGGPNPMIIRSQHAVYELEAFAAGGG